MTIRKHVNLTDYLTGKVPKKVLDAVEKVKLTPSEWSEWESSKPDGVSITRRGITVRLYEHLSWRKVILLGSSISALIGTIIAFIIKYLPVIRPLLPI